MSNDTNAVEPNAVEPNAVEPNAVEPNAVEPNAVEPNTVHSGILKPDEDHAAGPGKAPDVGALSVSEVVLPDGRRYTNKP